MCTAVTYKTRDHYFGRNLDMESLHQETITVTPRNYPFSFRKTGTMEHHFAMIGMAYIADGYPLYYDATNEKGLSMAGLHFPQNADYKPYCGGKDNIAPFELIPWILGQCSTVSQVEKMLGKLNLLHEDFSEALPLSPLHWMISDRERSVTLESVKEGIRVYDNPVGVLTNNPPFEVHLLHLNNYMHLTSHDPENTFAGKNDFLKLEPYSHGMGAIGLPGDAGLFITGTMLTKMILLISFGPWKQHSLLPAPHTVTNCYSAARMMLTMSLQTLPLLQVQPPQKP